jgi:hypothetical protein
MERPTQLNSLSLAEFVRNYALDNARFRDEENTEADSIIEIDEAEDLSESGETLTLQTSKLKLKNRKNPAVISFPFLTLDNDTELYYYRY